MTAPWDLYNCRTSHLLQWCFFLLKSTVIMFGEETMYCTAVTQRKKISVPNLEDWKWIMSCQVCIVPNLDAFSSRIDRRCSSSSQGGYEMGYSFINFNLKGYIISRFPQCCQLKWLISRWSRDHSISNVSIIYNNDKYTPTHLITEKEFYL